MVPSLHASPGSAAGSNWTTANASGVDVSNPGPKVNDARLAPVPRVISKKYSKFVGLPGLQLLQNTELSVRDTSSWVVLKLGAVN